MIFLHNRYEGCRPICGLRPAKMIVDVPSPALAFQPTNKISFCFLCSVPTTLQTKISTTEKRVTRSLKKLHVIFWSQSYMQDFSLKLKLQSKIKKLHVTIKKLHVIFFWHFQEWAHANSKKNIKILNRVQSLFSITSKPPFFSFPNQHFPLRD